MAYLLALCSELFLVPDIVQGSASCSERPEHYLKRRLSSVIRDDQRTEHDNMTPGFSAEVRVGHSRKL